METTASEPLKKSFKWSVLVLIVSILFVLIMCAVTIGAIYLDVAGEHTVGVLNNVAVNCDSGKTCFTGKVTFATDSGAEITFSPLLQTPFIYELDVQIKRNNDESRTSKSIDVRYLKSNPKIAKVALALYLDYANKINFLFWGSVVILFSWIASRDKPFFVLNLRKK